MTTRTPEEAIRDRLISDERIRERLLDFLPRDARSRYFQTSDGTMFAWTTERLGDGKFASGVYVPKGPGSRSGKRNVTRWEVARELHHATRKGAKSRAYRMFLQHRARLDERLARREPDIMCGHPVGTFGHVDGCPDDERRP